MKSLTPRQIEVIQLVAAGESSKQIADALNVSISTVKKHRGEILKRLNCQNMFSAISRWTKRLR